jgi:hypothetical protein
MLRKTQDVKNLSTKLTLDKINKHFTAQRSMLSMSKPVLSIEVEGRESILKLKKSQDAEPAVKIALKVRDRPELTGIQCSFQREDLEVLKEIRESVSVVLPSAVRLQARCQTIGADSLVVDAGESTK